MQAIIEIANADGVETLASLPSEDNTTTVLHLDELSRLRISVKEFNDTTRFLVGFLELQPYEDLEESRLLFARGDIPQEMLEKCGFFSQPFVNQIGRSTLCLEHEGQAFQIDIQLESTKVGKNEVLGWLDKICEEFPVFELPSLMTPISELGATQEQRSGFRSLLSFVKEANALVDGVKAKVDKPRYLKMSYERQASLYGNQLNRAAMYSSSWVRPGMRWKPVQADRQTIVKKGLKSFEPEKYPSLSGHSSFLTDLNVYLLETLYELAGCCRAYKLNIKTRVFEIDELRTQFGSGNAAKFSLFRRYDEALNSLEKKVNELIQKLEGFGIRYIRQPGKMPYDSRYRQLCNDISDLDECARQLSKYQSVPTKYLGILGLDFIFEFFAYAQLVSAIKNLGFELVDADEGFPLCNYLKFMLPGRDLGIRLIYDFHVPKAGENKKNFPVWDYWDGTDPVRPDFIVHLFSSDYEEVAILDAKYKGAEKCRADFNTFKRPESLVVKYGTKLYSSGGNKIAPIYVGALCCETDLAEETKHIWLAKSEDELNGLAQECGITTLRAKDNHELSVLLSGLIDSFYKKSDAGQQQEISETSKIHLSNFQTSKLTKKYDKGSAKQPSVKRVTSQRRTLTREDRARSLNSSDARIIKGMLIRGDIPQHIAQYFGVNNGRISDIKNSNTFNEVVPAPADELPPSGPYPSIENLLKINPELLKYL